MFGNGHPCNQGCSNSLTKFLNRINIWCLATSTFGHPTSWNFYAPLPSRLTSSPQTLDQTIQIYQHDRQVGRAGEGMALWTNVQTELRAVLQPRASFVAPDMIAWWHQLWKDADDTPARAASRVRRHAATALRKRRKRPCADVLNRAVSGPILNLDRRGTRPLQLRH
jgi:hypothetical protein